MNEIEGNLNFFENEKRPINVTLEVPPLINTDETLGKYDVCFGNVGVFKTNGELLFAGTWVELEDRTYNGTLMVELPSEGGYIFYAMVIQGTYSFVDGKWNLSNKDYVQASNVAELILVTKPVIDLEIEEPKELSYYKQ